MTVNGFDAVIYTIRQKRLLAKIHTRIDLPSDNS
jgi:hypothetical protein